eukprot:scaffold1678_cov110-Isochrysis_galbana.AAC.13
MSPRAQWACRARRSASVSAMVSLVDRVDRKPPRSSASISRTTETSPMSSSASTASSVPAYSANKRETPPQSPSWAAARMAVRSIEGPGSPPAARIRPSRARTSACRCSSSPSRARAPYARGDKEAPVCSSAQSSSSAPLSKFPTRLRPMTRVFSTSSPGAIVSQCDFNARTEGDCSERRSNSSILR